MKILDRYILTSYLKTFISVFVILMLIFVLQAIWLYIKELAGKDLDPITIAKFLFYITPTLIPLILPLTILLASIMVFGNFAENYEFAAMKSTGISLQRAMSGLSIFIVALAIVTFFFSNNVIPWAEYNSYNLRKNIAKLKPQMAIAEGQFNQIGENFNIKVSKKSGERGELLENVIIHQSQKHNPGNHKTIIAKNGELVNAEKSDVLKLILYDGYYYDDTPPKKHEQKEKKPFVKSAFNVYTMNIDLSQLNTVDLDDKSYSDKYSMLNIKELTHTTDSLHKQRQETYSSNAISLYKRSNIQTLNLNIKPKKDSIFTGNILDLFSTKRKIQLLGTATNIVSSSKNNINTYTTTLKTKTNWLNRHIIALHEKFALAFACVILFFVGAPLGALIKKGGLGLPMVIAIVIFLSYHFIGIFAKNSAKDGTINPILATWFSTLIMLPLSIYLTSRATKDRQLFDTDSLLEPLKKLFNVKKKELIESKTIFNNNTKQYQSLQNLDNNKLIGVIKNYRTYNYSIEHKNTAIAILNSRGISKQELKLTGNLTNQHYQESIRLKNNYEEDSKLAFILYLIALVPIILGLVFKNNKLPTIGTILLTIGVIIFILFIFSLTKSFSKHANLYKHLGKNNSFNAILFSIIGMPLYIPFYYLQKKQINKDLHLVKQEVLAKKKVRKTKSFPQNKEYKSLLKASIITIIIASCFVILHFVFANNKLPEYAVSATQLSIITLIVSLFYYIKAQLAKIETIETEEKIATIKSNVNTNAKSLSQNASYKLFSTNALILFLISVTLLILHLIFNNNKFPQLASIALQLSGVLYIVYLFYFIKAETQHKKANHSKSINYITLVGLFIYPILFYLRNKK